MVDKIYLGYQDLEAEIKRTKREMCDVSVGLIIHVSKASLNAASAPALYINVEADLQYFLPESSLKAR